LASVSFCGRSSAFIGAKPRIIGSALKQLKNENGATLCTPSGLVLDTHAIGRGTTLEIAYT
jgi:hypothetical protein